VRVSDQIIFLEDKMTTTKQKVNLDRVRKGMKNISMDGVPDTWNSFGDRQERSGRIKIIEEAIAMIQKNGKTAMKKEYLGMKNYAAFGDQRTDCEYGYGPTHGSIVFRVGRTDDDKETTLGDDEIYALLCARDFESILDEKNSEQYREVFINLFDVIGRVDDLKEDIAPLEKILEKAEVEE